MWIIYSWQKSFLSSAKLCLIAIHLQKWETERPQEKIQTQANDYTHRCDTARKHTLPKKTHLYEDISVSDDFKLALPKHTLFFPHFRKGLEETVVAPDYLTSSAPAAVVQQHLQ